MNINNIILKRYELIVSYFTPPLDIDFVNFYGIFHDTNKTIFHYQNGKLHRENGPAMEFFDGSKIWMQDGMYHRKDGPAVIESDGYKAWWFNDELHRINGPAVEYLDGRKEYYIEGIHYSDSQDYWKTIKELNDSK